MIARAGVRCRCLAAVHRPAVSILRPLPAAVHCRTFVTSTPQPQQSAADIGNEEERIENDTESSVTATAASSSSSLSSKSHRSTTVPQFLNGVRIDLTELPCPAPTFHDLKVPAHLCHQLQHANITHPTIIQSATMPHLMRRPPTDTDSPLYSFPDVLINEMSGEGKTLSYLLPLLAQVTPYLHATQAIIVTPTRELAGQIELVIAQLNDSGKKSRARNRLRVDLCVGDVNPSLCSSLTRPKSVADTSTSKDSHPSVPPQSFSESFSEQLPIQPSPVPHIIIGTPRTLHDVLITRSLLDLRSLKYLVFDEIDALLNKPNSQPYIAPLIALRSEMPLSFTSKNSKALMTMTDQQKQLLQHHPRTQVVMVSATLTQPVLAFAAVHLAKHRKLITAASVPSECLRRNRSLLIGPSPSSLSVTSRDSAVSLTQLPHLPSHIAHHFVTLPSNAGNRQRNQHLFSLCLAIYHTYREKHSHHIRAPVRGSKIIRTGSQSLNGGLQSLPPSRSPYIPQTTALLFNNPYEIFPLLPLFAQPINDKGQKLKLGILSSLASRTERRDALSMNNPPDILLCEASVLARGLDLKSLTHLVNVNVPANVIDYLHRAGRVGRKGSINSHEGTVVTVISEGSGDEERVAKLVRGTGGSWLSQLVVRGEKLFSRHRHSWLPITRQHRARGDEEEPVKDATVVPLNEASNSPSFLRQLVEPRYDKHIRRARAASWSRFKSHPAAQSRAGASGRD